MRHTVSGLAFVATATLAIGTASAADLKPVYKAQPAPVAAFNWTGWYIGGHVGYGWGKGDTSIGFIDTPAAAIGPAVAAGAVPVAFSPDPDGLFGGLQLGYNYQAANWLLGFETDISFSGIDGSQTINTAVPGLFPVTSAVTQELDWFGTIRGRVGWVGGNWLFYATGGGAYGQVKSSYLSENTSGGGLIFNSGTASETKWGWTVGGGLEYGWDRWTLRAEYLYIDLADLTFSVPVNVAPDASLIPNVENQFHIVRVGLNYRFDYGKTPVMAKY